VTHWGLITVCASLAVAEAIERFASPLMTSIKWPNDVLLQGKKCSGILLESALSAQNPPASGPVVLGIGINVNQETFPAETVSPATSMLLETGRHIPRMELLADVLNRFEKYYDELLEQSNTPLVEAYTARMAYREEESTLRFAGKNEVVRGHIEGISPTGALCLRTPSGVRTFHAGEVTSQPPA
jgi:BirA family biotin operon repressor/biotin-[acetyl-CoA-carboxylase] ligase